MGMLVENGRNAEGLLPGLGALRCELAFDLGDQRGGTSAPGSFGEAFPAGKRREDQRLTSGRAQSVEGHSPPAGRVLLGAIEQYPSTGRPAARSLAWRPGHSPGRSTSPSFGP